MARRRAVGKELKGDVGEYSTISIENIICINSREIKVSQKKLSKLKTFSYNNRQYNEIDIVGVK